MRKLTLILLVILFIESLAPVIALGDTIPIRVMINGEPVEFDVMPVIVKGRTLVPVRAIFEGLGMGVEWDPATMTVTGRSEDVVIQLVIGNKTAIKNNREIELDVPAMIVEGRTMVPVRFIGESIGAVVDWDGSTNTVLISKPKPQVIEVETAREFVEAIGPNRVILLKDKDYNLSQVAGSIKNEYVRWEEQYDGTELVIENVSNLTIRGINEDYSNILIEPRYADVLTFINCNNVRIENINAGHFPEKGECAGGVLYFEDCKDINIENCRLFGCGTVGVTLVNAEGVTFNRSEITECSEGIMYIQNSKYLTFKDSRFIKNESSFDFIEIQDSSNISFDGCEVSENSYVDVEGLYSTNTYLFSIRDCRDITLQNCTIASNNVRSFMDGAGLLKLEGIRLKDNAFGNNVEYIQYTAGLKEALQKFWNHRELKFDIERKLNCVYYDGEQIYETSLNSYINCTASIGAPFGSEESLTTVIAQQTDVDTLERKLSFLQQNNKIIIKYYYDGEIKYEVINLDNQEDTKAQSIIFSLSRMLGISPKDYATNTFKLVKKFEKVFEGDGIKVDELENGNIKYTRLLNKENIAAYSLPGVFDELASAFNQLSLELSYIINPDKEIVCFGISISGEDGTGEIIDVESYSYSESIQIDYIEQNDVDIEVNAFLKDYINQRLKEEGVDIPIFNR